MRPSNLPPGVSDYDIERQAAGGDPRVMSAIEAASDAFWAAIATRFPEIKTGDFPPDADFAFEAAQVAAVETWLWANTPEPEYEDESVLDGEDLYSRGVADGRSGLPKRHDSAQYDQGYREGGATNRA